ncbi:aminotransferase class IV family protein [Phaeobacter inhibens]|uniref:aminotransferase class IV family protein n=1 Tax=Phaeobacter inhibens TaxID=221822 RepID=UPI000C9C1DAE|nr:aminotransferase class IV family protein [Phaeobacter inhibens]AUQ63319.1 putative aminotransferase, class IV [Phaeobacter inhibens]AUQ83225.1 putative aminotransferase, class IV [Phaeobacter inhibens]AUQ90984.1 putative aminotransferase, class IV [Phaeobacter inhibens]MDO6757273.1 aminotransferase class IV family protein [Phaeobacter inhibens]
MESPVRPRDAIQNDPAFRLIETLGWHPGQGFRHLSQHLARMARSAAAFDLAFDAEEAARVLAEVTGTARLRCRLTLGVDGQLALVTAPLGPSPSQWRLGIAKTQLDAGDIWLQHKTTRRALYDAARANLPEGVDELLFLNEHGAICEGTITNIFVTRADGLVVTPPLICGLLPGILRQVMLDGGQCTEAVLHPQDLFEVKAIHMGNSLRGLIPARLV